MIGYKDMTFCASECVNKACRRYWSDEHKAAAREWWGKGGAPVSFHDFTGTCTDYIEPAPTGCSSCGRESESQYCEDCEYWGRYVAGGSDPRLDISARLSVPSPTATGGRDA